MRPLTLLNPASYSKWISLRFCWPETLEIEIEVCLCVCVCLLACVCVCLPNSEHKTIRPPQPPPSLLHPSAFPVGPAAASTLHDDNPKDSHLPVGISEGWLHGSRHISIIGRFAKDSRT